MAASKMKNLIIFILLLVNVFLLLLVVPARLQDRRQAEDADAQLTELFRQNGVTLRQEDIPSSRTCYDQLLTVERDAQTAAAMALLGQQTLVQETDAGVHYSSALGSGVLAADGSFSVRLTSGEKVNPTVHAQTLLGRMDVTYASLRQSQEGGSTVISAVLTVDGLPVTDHALRFYYDEDVLTRVEGLLLPGVHKISRTGSDPSCVARDALVAFLGSRMETGWMGSRIDSVVQGWALSRDAAQNGFSLRPAWKISTDAGTYLVDAVTKTVTGLAG